MAQPIDAVLTDAARLTAAGRPQDAIEALRPVLAEHPDHPGAWCGLAAALLDVGDAEHCLDAAKRAITLGEPAWAHRLASLALTELGRHEEAAISARESARRSPGDWRGYVTLAEALGPIAPADALTAARRAVATAPDEPRTHEVLGSAAERAGETDVASRAYRESLRLDPTNVEVKAALSRLARPGSGNGTSRFGDVPWERATGWQDTVADEPDWTLVDAEPVTSRAAKAAAGEPESRFGATRAADPDDRFAKGPGKRGKRPGAPRAARTGERRAFDENRGSARADRVADDGRESNGGGPRAADSGGERVVETERPADSGSERIVNGGAGVKRAQRSDRRFGRARRIGLWLVLRRCAGWLAAGSFLLLVAGLPTPSPLLVWFGLALLLTVGGIGGFALFRLPADIRLTPKSLYALDRLMTVAAGVVVLGLGVLTIWTAALAIGSTSMTLLTPVIILGLLALTLGGIGLRRMRFTPNR